MDSVVNTNSAAVLVVASEAAQEAEVILTTSDRADRATDTMECTNGIEEEDEEDLTLVW